MITPKLVKRTLGITLAVALIGTTLYWMYKTKNKPNHLPYFDQSSNLIDTLEKPTESPKEQLKLKNKLEPEEQKNNLEDQKTESLLDQVQKGNTPLQLNEWARGKKLSKEERYLIVVINRVKDKTGKWPIWKSEYSVKYINNINELINQLQEQ